MASRPGSDLRVIVGHNFYRSSGGPSGENLAVDAEVASLREAGVEVRELYRRSDEVERRRGLAQVRTGLEAISNPAADAELSEMLRGGRCDALHLHNVYPGLSPSVIDVAHAHGVPVVQTVHNYRHVCVAGTYYRDGGACTDCRGKSLAAPAVRHGCYRGSRAQSAAMAASLALNRRRWRRVDTFVALSAFMAAFLVDDLGVAEERVVVRPTSVADPGPPGPGGSDVVFLGRLDDAKGISMLVQAWNLLGSQRLDHRLVVVGDGPLAAELRGAVGPTVVFRGAQPAEEVHRVLASARLLVVPSRWFEGYPRVVAEAFAHGVPVLASGIGSLGSIVPPTAGWTVRPTAAAFAEGLRVALTGNAADLRRRGAREHYERELTPAAALDRLLAVYRRPACRPV